jgi:hypothetical protein
VVYLQYQTYTKIKMHTFIPHKNNPHTFRKIIGVIAVIALSATLVYFGQIQVAKSQIKIETLKSQSALNTMQENFPAAAVAIPQIENVQVQSEETAVKEIVDSKQIGISLEEAAAPVPPVVRDKDPKKRLDEARIFAKPQILEGKYIDVSLAHQNMVLFENGEFVDAYLISSGKRGMETPTGTYYTQNKVPRAWSRAYGLYMPNWMALVSSGSIGIHELPEWPGGYKEGANHLGTPVSHGCIRLGEGAAKRVYDWADLGTTVIVHK